MIIRNRFKKEQLEGFYNYFSKHTKTLTSYSLNTKNKKLLMASQDKRNYIYLYDLPKKITTSILIAEAFKAQGIDISSRKPQI